MDRHSGGLSRAPSSLPMPVIATATSLTLPPPNPRIYVRRPGGALAPFVESIWYFTSNRFAHQRERILPSGSMQLLVNLDQDEIRTYHGPGYAEVKRQPGAVLSGAYGGHFAIDTAEQRSIAGVAFRSGGAYPFFRPPADEVAGAHVGLDDLWGRDGANLRERLLEANGPEAILDTLEREPDQGGAAARSGSRPRFRGERLRPWRDGGDGAVAPRR